MVTNPAAGGGRAAKAAAIATRRLVQRGIRPRTVCETNAEQTVASARAAVAGGTELMIVVGGDGLVHLLLPLLAGTGVQLGVVPAGTGNDFARALGIPLHDPAAAVDAIVESDPLPVDLGRSGKGWFATVLTGGFDSRVAQRAQRIRWPRGRARYNLALLAELGLLRPVAYRLELDGSALDFEAVLVCVGNTSSYGGGMRICPDARPDDGLLSVTVVGPVSRRELVRVFPRVYRGAHTGYPQVRTYQAETVALTADGTPADTPVYADGERFGSLPVTCRATPGALLVRRPAP